MNFTGLDARRSTRLFAGLAVFTLASVIVVCLGILRGGDRPPQASFPDVAWLLHGEAGQNQRETLALSEKARQFIWEVERHAFGLSQVLAPRLASSVARGDR